MNLLKYDKNIEIIAPFSGFLINIEDVPDQVFAEKIIGDGIAIRPDANQNIIMAPIKGNIIKIFETNHAFSINSDDGIEMIIHFGIDTVQLKGEGFTRIAKENQNVNQGDPIISFNFSLLEKRAPSIITPIVIANMDKIKEIVKFAGYVVGGKDTIMSIKI
ncbi:PTS glucose transporter subunit IIA [Candidatus Schneideria nysicola]|uniref:PTS glucose transporter subunit IIA n=1 Tax=Candidatus Schneideria nysicola TaxID=1081631 RepID=UPI001CAA7D76|nr:PTS glucose transporter subunit IIA [Candidatus Schneideria nysicola]UAJ65528.1 PTS glucose transporter subunit IIA [Candidatus Schneideria nysicola]